MSAGAWTSSARGSADGRWFRTLTVLDIYTRESLALVADRSLTGRQGRGGAEPTCCGSGGADRRSRVDNGGEFVSRAMDAWAYAHDVRLDFIRPGKPVENAFIESFNGKLRDECLNSHVFALRRRSAARAWTPGVKTTISSARIAPCRIGRRLRVGAMWVDSREPRESTAAQERPDRTRDHRSLRRLFRSY